MSEIDTVLMSLYVNPTTAGVFADWFDERGADWVADELCADRERDGNELLYRLVRRTVHSPLFDRQGRRFWTGYLEAVNTLLDHIEGEFQEATGCPVLAVTPEDRVTVHLPPTAEMGVYSVLCCGQPTSMRTHQFARRYQDRTRSVVARCTVWYGRCVPCAGHHHTTIPGWSGNGVKVAFQAG